MSKDNTIQLEFTITNFSSKLASKSDGGADGIRTHDRRVSSVTTVIIDPVHFEHVLCPDLEPVAIPD